MKLSRTTSSKRPRFGLAVAAVFTSLAIGNANAELQDGLLSYWDFENNFNDTAANFSVDSTVADHGTGGSAVVFATDGPLGTYGDFQRTGLGTQNLVVVPNSDDILAGGESLTISAWFRVDGFNQNWQAIIAHGEGTDWRIARRAAEQGLGYAGGVGDIPGAAGITPNINDAGWHHVVAITEAGVSTRLWIDGTLIGTSAAAPTLTNSASANLYIGGNPIGNAADTNANQYRPWNGGIDDVALWNRPLTEAEITQLYNSGVSGLSLKDLFNPDDLDNDGLPDAWETANGLSPSDNGDGDINNGPLGDPDMDGSNNAAEFANNTNPQDDDSDDDFSLDGAEATNGTNPNDPDTDKDTLVDGHETGTGIFVSATDTGTDPIVSDLDVDSDSDGLFNVWEIINGLNPNDDGTTDPANGAAGDPDNDSSLNSAEQTNKTDPQDDDSDDDFSLDGAEATNGTNPLNPDTDGDSLLDGHETNNGSQSYVSPTNTGTNPMVKDTDLDGYNDDVEITLGTDPTDINSAPAPSTLPIFDDFEDNSLDVATWSTITGTVSQNAQGSVLGGTINEVGGNIAFGSRGYLYTATEFDPEVVGGLEITGEITFLTVQDIVSVLTRSNAVPLAVYGEAESGIQFILSANGDTVNIVARNGDHIVQNAIVTGTIDFVANVVYVFKVIDDGAGVLSLEVHEKANPTNTISVTAELVGDTSAANHVVIYNREGGRNSNLHQLEIKTLAGPVQAEILDISFDPAAGVNGNFTLNWSSQLNATYAIYASADLISWDIEVNDEVIGQDGTTSATFTHPSPGQGKLFFRIEPPRP